MEPIRNHTGLVAPLNRANVDTDQIIPKQFLKRIERTGYEGFLFFDWRYSLDGKPNPEFVLNDARYGGATILVANRNFGCGSSREHAVWALHDFGFRVVIASSFADIFTTNCTKNGILTVILEDTEVNEILRRAAAIPGYRLTVDLAENAVADEHGLSLHFAIDPFRKYCLLNGLDEIGLTLEYSGLISEFENQHQGWMKIEQGR